ncbi:MAG: TIGR03618 family F420-dependent PPOX class oxidoreductase [Chloroflexota bacterium]
MPIEDIDTLLSKPNHAIVGINRAVGAPQLTVVWYLWDGKSFSFSTTKDRAKYLNLKRDPSISLLVDNLEEGWYVVAYGQAEINEQDADFSRRLFRKYLPEDPRAQHGDNDPNRVMVVVFPEKIITGH